MGRNRINELMDGLTNGSISRRDFIKGATAAGMSATAIASGLASASAAPSVGSKMSMIRAATDPTTLVIADALNQGDWLTADPGWYFEITPSAMMNLIYESLYDIPDTTKPNDFVPLLAEALPVMADDGLSATIKLREGVKFVSTGNPLTTKDFVWSWNRLRNIKYQGAFLVDEFGGKFEAVDDFNLKLTFDAPKPALVAILATMELGAIDSVFVQTKGGTDAEDADTTDTAKDFLDGTSAGTGPYQLIQWDLNGEVIVQKNPDYWGEAPAFDKIIWRNVTDTSTMLQLVQSGDVDIAVRLDPDQAETVRSDENLQVITGPTLNIEYLGMHNDPDKGGPLSNPAVRQAIGHAIDYKGIIDQLLLGAGSQPATMVPEPLMGTDLVADLKYTTDLVKAQELFDSAAVAPAEFTLTFASPGFAEGGVALETLAAKLQSDIQGIQGLTVKLNPMDGTDRLTEYRAGNLQSTISPWSPDYVDPQTYIGPFAMSTGSAAKRLSYVNTASDDLANQAAVELDPVKRAELYSQVMTNLINDATFLVLYQTIAQFPASKAVQGVIPHAVYILQLEFASKTA